MGYFVIAAIFAAWIGWGLYRRRVDVLWFLFFIGWVDLEAQRDLQPFWFWFGIVSQAIIVVACVVKGLFFSFEAEKKRSPLWLRFLKGCRIRAMLQN